jgi:hypothetical protein
MMRGGVQDRGADLTASEPMRRGGLRDRASDPTAPAVVEQAGGRGCEGQYVTKRLRNETVKYWPHGLAPHAIACSESPTTRRDCERNFFEGLTSPPHLSCSFNDRLGTDDPKVDGSKSHPAIARSQSFPQRLHGR